jgi:glycosyltransferase involved in cell wall biosynthesis
MAHNLAPITDAAHAQAMRPGAKIQAVGVVVPARNQSQMIAECVLRIFAANSHSGWHTSLWIVVVADACTDATAKVAREALGAFGQVLEVTVRSQQAAHRIGARAVLEHFRHVPRHGLIIASADANTNLNREWIDSQLRCADSPLGLCT